MHSRPRQDPVRGARLILRAAYVVLSLVTAAALGGCPGGAVLEDPERFPQYDGGPPGVGGAGMAGMAGVGGADAGTAGAAGTGPTYVWDCATPLETPMTGALAKNCARAFCHEAPNPPRLPAAGLELTTVEKVREMVNKPASYKGIGCNVPPESFRECGPTELPAGCVPGKLLIDPVNFDDSWVVKKLNLTKTELDCGDPMPIAPGNSASQGWDAAGERKQCFIDFFRSLAAPQ